MLLESALKPGDRLSLLESIVQASPAFIHVLSGSNLVFEFANEAYYRLVGRRDLLGHPAFEAMPEAAAGGYPQRIAEVMASKQPFRGSELPVQLARTPGAAVEERVIDIVYIPLLEADGSCHRVLGYGTDVTENVVARRDAQAAQRRTQRRLESSLTAGRMATWEWNVAENLISGSAMLNDLFGLGAGTSPFPADFGRRLLHPDDRTAHELLVDQAIADESFWHTEYRVQRADGTLIWCEEVAEVTRDQTTKVLMIVGFVWDITARKEADRMLREADSRKSDFLATLAHELRNPMAPIRTGLQLLKRLPQGDARIDKTLAVMERQTDHLVRLVDDLMEVNRISKGKVELRKKTVILDSSVAAAIEATKSLFEAKQIELVQGTLESVPVLGDSDRLIQVFSNLLTNAVKFTEPGGRVWLSLGREGSQAVAIVRDNGCGIGADVIGSVFDMFSQGPSHENAGGMGIGLALVRELVHLHGGSVQAQSEGQGSGSTFSIRLPVAPAMADIELSGVVEEPPSLSIGRRILIVDDNGDAADSLATALELEGHLVEVAYDGIAALATYERAGPEVVLLDLGMPQMNGYEVAARLRTLNGGAEVHLFAVSGFGSAQDKIRVLQAGFDAHFTKPVAVLAIRNALSGIAPRPRALEFGDFPQQNSLDRNS